MAVSSGILSIQYFGNNSTVVPYSIPYPFIDPLHIAAAVSMDGVGPFVALTPSEFTVTKAEVGAGGEMLTLNPIPVIAKVLIFRAVPLTQPTSFEPAGPFPAESTETLADRLLMQLQQVQSRVRYLEGYADDSVEVIPDTAPNAGSMTWENAAARATTQPRRIGQLGIQRDDGSIWHASALTPGAWVSVSAVSGGWVSSINPTTGLLTFTHPTHGTRTLRLTTP